MSVNTTEYVAKALFDVKLFDLETGACLAVLRRERNKETNWSRTGDTLYAEANGSKLIGFGDNKAEMLSMQSAVISDGVLAVQSGSEMIPLTSSTAVLYTDDEMVVSTLSATSKYTATGTVDAEFDALHLLNADGTLGTRLTQVSSPPASADEFSYASGTKTLTLFGLADGQKLVGFYYPTLASGKHFQNRGDVFARTVKVVADGLFRSVCTGKDYDGQLVFDKAQVGENYEFTLSSGGEPAVNNLELEALLSCAEPTLSNLYIFDGEADFV